MSTLATQTQKVRRVLKTRSLIWATEHIPHNFSRFRIKGVENVWRRSPAASDCVQYPAGEFNLQFPIPSLLYEATAEFMRTDPYTDGKITFRQQASAWKINKGRVYTNRASQFFVISHADRVLWPVSFKHEDAKKGVPENRISVDVKYFPEPKKFSGRALSLVLGGGPSTNIYHWMIDGLSKLRLAESICPLSEIDHFLVQGRDNGFRRKSLEMLGIPASKIHFFDQQLIHLQADELIATSHPRGRLSNVTPNWAIKFHRQRYLPQLVEKSTPWPEKIYISRKDSNLRGVVNETKVMALLRKYGFKEIVLSEHDFDAKIALFHHAREIISMSGACFAFLMYCQPQTKVLELFPAGFVHYANAAIASQTALDYHFEIFGTNAAEKGGYRAQREEMEVDLSRLQQMLEK